MWKNLSKPQTLSGWLLSQLQQEHKRQLWLQHIFCPTQWLLYQVRRQARDLHKHGELFKELGSKCGDKQDKREVEGRGESGG